MHTIPIPFQVDIICHLIQRFFRGPDAFFHGFPETVHHEEDPGAGHRHPPEEEAGVFMPRIWHT